MVSINDDSLYMYPNFVVSLGPESISMDITFHDFAHVYGIPVSNNFGFIFLLGSDMKLVL